MCACSYTTGTFTADAVAREISPAFVGAVMAMNNSAEVIAALAFGRLSDKLGRCARFILGTFPFVLS
jgi:MFS family permease